MEYSQVPFHIYADLNNSSWPSWQQPLSDRSYPSQYVSRQNNQSLSDSTSSFFSQYPTTAATTATTTAAAAATATEYTPHTCPIPQLQSPYQDEPYSQQNSRPKSMSWPQGMFTEAPTSSGAWLQQYQQQHGSFSIYYPQNYHYQQMPEPFADPRMSAIAPGTPGYVPVSEESKTPMPPSVAFKFDALSAANASPNNDTRNSSVASPSSMQDTATSVHSTPMSMSMSLHSLSAQPDLMGLNCHFSPPCVGQAQTVPWSLRDGDDHEPSTTTAVIAVATTTAETTTASTAGTTSLAVGQTHPAPLPKAKPKRRAPPSRTFACDFCDMTFDRKSNLKDHARTHGVGKRCVPCHFPGCKKFYGRKADVNRHVRSFHQKDSVSCDHCHKKFLRSDSLTRHNIDNCRHQRDSDMNATAISPPPQWLSRPISSDEIHRMIKA